MMDKSTRNLATMLAEGSGQGVLDCKRAETDYPQASPRRPQVDGRTVRVPDRGGAGVEGICVSN